MSAHEKRRLVSVVLSFRNEEEVIPEFLQRAQSALQPLPLDHEFIFVNDASTDGSRALLTERSRRDPRIKALHMSRRFGAMECIVAGLKHASGDAVIYMDCDLQDPPELLARLIEEWSAGADVVHTVRTKREGEPRLKMLLTSLAYRLINLFSDTKFLHNAGDFKLLSRRALKELLALEERTPYLRGLVAWIGFRQVAVPYERYARGGGSSKFPLFSHFFSDMMTLQGPVGHLIVAMTSFSILPIVILLVMGAVLFACGLLAVAAGLCTAAGPRTFTLGVLAALSGTQLLGIGTLGIYLGRIYQDVRRRPQYIVESTTGFSPPGPAAT